VQTAKKYKKKRLFEELLLDAKKSANIY